MRHLSPITLLPRAPLPTTTTIPNLHPPLTLGPPKPRLQRNPALLVIIPLHLPARLQPPIRHADHEAALKHKRHAPLRDLGGLEIDVAGALVRHGVRAVRAHDVVQGGAGGLEAAAGFGVVLAVDEAHEFAHRVAVVPGWAEGVYRIGEFFV